MATQLNARLEDDEMETLREAGDAAGAGITSVVKAWIAAGCPTQASTLPGVPVVPMVGDVGDDQISFLTEQLTRVLSERSTRRTDAPSSSSPSIRPPSTP